MAYIVKEETTHVGYNGELVSVQYFAYNTFSYPAKKDKVTYEKVKHDPNVTLHAEGALKNIHGVALIGDTPMNEEEKNFCGGYVPSWEFDSNFEK